VVCLPDYGHVSFTTVQKLSLISCSSFSMVLGRPMIAPCQITVPLPTTTEDDDILDIDIVSENMSRPSPIIFLGEIVKLYVTLAKILSNVYKPGQRANDELGEDSKSEGLNTVMSLDEEVSNFEDNMPSWLHWERGIRVREFLPENQRMLLSKQSNLLHARSVKSGRSMVITNSSIIKMPPSSNLLASTNVSTFLP
jgi:hypothetical protein